MIYIPIFIIKRNNRGEKTIGQSQQMNEAHIKSMAHDYSQTRKFYGLMTWDIHTHMSSIIITSVIKQTEQMLYSPQSKPHICNAQLGYSGKYSK